MNNLLYVLCFSMLGNYAAASDNPEVFSPNLPANKGTIAAFERGAPITNVQILRVVSDSVPNGEIIASDQYTTLQNHQGRVRIQTLELGYGAMRLSLNGIAVPISAMISVDLVCRDRNRRLRLCIGNEVADGFFRTWIIPRFRNGNYLYEVTSSNRPWNTKAKTLYIQ